MFKLSGSKHPNLLLVYEKVKKIYDKNFISERKRKRKKIFRFLRRFIIGIITIFAIIAFYLSTHFINIYHIQKTAVFAKENIDRAIELLGKQNNDGALYYSELAKNDFDLSTKYLAEYKKSFLIKNSKSAYSQYSDLMYLLSAGKTLSSSVSEMAKVQKGLNNILKSEENNYSLNFVYESVPELFGVKANIDLSLSYLSNIKYQGVLRPFQVEIKGMEKKLFLASYLLDKQIALSNLLPSFLGYPDESKYLVLFQNSKKLTATGGRIEAYGVLKNKAGKLVDFTSFNSQRLDEKVQDNLNMTLPDALETYTDKEKWLLSDANWSPDLAYTVDKITGFYQKETSDSSDFDGLIFINDNFIKEFLNLTGPIVVDNNSYSATNFYRIFQKNGNKEDLGKILKVLQTEVFSGDSSNIFNIFNLLSSNFSKKNIILYFNDINLQELAETKGWSNEIKKTKSDYFMIIDSNLSDSAEEDNIKKRVDYQLDQGSNGLFAKIDIRYINHASSVYRNYIRIYLPIGSELLTFKGIEDNTLKILEDQKNEKAIYEGLVNIEPNQIANLEVYYKLPDAINNLALSGNYNLLVQKQAGANIDSLIVDLSFLNGIKLYNPTGFSADLISNEQVVWDTNLLTDRYFSINF